MSALREGLQLAFAGGLCVACVFVGLSWLWRAVRRSTWEPAPVDDAQLWCPVWDEPCDVCTVRCGRRAVRDESGRLGAWLGIAFLTLGILRWLYGSGVLNG